LNFEFFLLASILCYYYNKSVLKVFLNILFPHRCVICQRTLEDGDVCETCFSKIPVFGWIFCNRCGSRLENFTPCSSCRYLTALAGIGTATDYRLQNVKTLIHAFKYRRRQSLADPLTELLLRHLSLNGLHKHLLELKAVVLPIPLTRRRERERGFNQAALLAEKLAIRTGLRYYPGALLRSIDRPPQVTMPDAKSRRQNIKGVFQAAKNNGLIRNSTILLVDDVASSGATLEEAARTLKRAGAKMVWGITVARGH
jgi:ComF family protein